MATSTSPCTSNLPSFFSKSNANNPKFQPFSNTHLNFPSTSPFISLKSQKNPLISFQNGPQMGTYNVQVVVEENEPEDRFLSRFSREVYRAGVIRESKRRRFFENSQEKRKRKTREAAKKYRTGRRRPKVVKQDIVEIPEKKGYKSDEDDWDLPKGDLPY